MPETCVPTEMRFCGFTVPEAVTDATTVACVTGAVIRSSLVRERTSSHAISAAASNSAATGQSRRGIFAKMAPVPPARPREAGIVVVDMTLPA